MKLYVIFTFKRVENEAKIVFMYIRVQNEPTKGFEVETSEE